MNVHGDYVPESYQVMQLLFLGSRQFIQVIRKQTPLLSDRVNDIKESTVSGT